MTVVSAHFNIIAKGDTTASRCFLRQHGFLPEYISLHDVSSNSKRMNNDYWLKYSERTYIPLWRKIACWLQLPYISIYTWKQRTKRTIASSKLSGAAHTVGFWRAMKSVLPGRLVARMHAYSTEPYSQRIHTLSSSSQFVVAIHPLLMSVTQAMLGWLKMTDMKMTDCQNCRRWNCTTKKSIILKKTTLNAVCSFFI